MTTANKITVLRILLVPVFIAAVLYYADTGKDWQRFLALATFAIAAASDALDGYIARRFNQKSELGAILDPLADKLLLVSGIVLLSRHGANGLDRIPFWLTMTVIGRDAILVLGLAIIYYACGAVKVRPHLVGKAATVLQMITVVWILLEWPSNGLRIWIWGAGLSTAISGVLYVIDGMRQLSASPSSAPAPVQDEVAAPPRRDFPSHTPTADK